MNMFNLWTFLAAVAIAMLAIATDMVPTGAPPLAIAGGERDFSIDWQRSDTPRGPEITGYVYNNGGLPAARVTVLVEGLDPSGRPVNATIAYVVGTVPALSRTYFVTSVPAATSYRVSLLSFDWVKGGSGA
jgi:hypothetical protein